MKDLSFGLEVFKLEPTDGVHPQIADDVGKVMSQDSSLADEEKHHEEQQQQQQHVFPPPPSVHESIPTQPVSPSTTQDASTITKEGIYVCHLCNFSGTRKDVFDAHMTTHFNHGCPYCDYTSRTEGRLKRHIKDFHSQDSLEAIEARKSRMMPGRPKVYRCKQCDFVATTKHTSQTNTDSQSHTQMRDEGRIEFWNHAKSHIKAEKLLQCPNCPFVTEYKHHLEYHLRNHYGSKPFKCNKCNYSCVNKSMLNSHMKSHTNVYQYRCADCTYATKYCHSLKLHLRKYNHKPATVLNMDGSLPQGFDTEAAGFTLLSKRSPARGPRGPRKDKVDPYIGHMFSLPPTSLPGIGQVMNGSMLPPYWPLMNQLPNGLQPPPLIPVSGVVTGSPQPQPPVPPPPPPPPPQASPQDHMVPSANLFKCNLCSMSAESNEALSMHLLKVHGAENQDLFNMFGISSDSFLEEQSLRNAGHGVHAMVPSAPPHSVCQPECIDSKPINSSSSLFVPNEAPAQPTGSPSHSWPIDMQTDTKPDLSVDGKTAVEISVIGSNGTSSPQSGSKNTTDIIKQMTLRFGAGPGNSDSIGMVDCPLDLTKPKSPTIYSFSNSREQMDQKLDSSEVSSSIENSLDTCSATPPKKRSRKGRAFKLDALTHKLREQQLSVSAEPPAQTDTRDEIGRNNSRSVEPLPEGADSQSDSNQGSDPVSFQIPPAERRSPIDEYQGGSFSSSAGTPNNEKPQLCNEDGSQISSAEYEQIHNNLQILNEEIQKEGLNDIPKPPPSLSHIGEGRNLPATSAAESIPGEMANDSVHQSLFNSYYSRRKSMPTPLRRGTELAWKILNDSCPPVMVPYQNGAVPCNGRRWSTNTTENVAANPSKLKLNLFSDGESYECSYCEIAFRNCAMYTMHMGYHGYQDPYKCNMCGHQSKDKIDFFLHIARAPHA